MFAIWEVLIFLTNTPEYLIPRPTLIIIDMLANYNFLSQHAAITMFEAVAGFLLANILGFLVAVIFVHYSIIKKGLYPYAIALKTTPIIALAPLLILWLGSGIESKVAASALICFFPILVNSVKGLKSVDKDALILMESYSATKWQIFTKLRVPTALPYIFSALKISTSLAVIGAIVGEFVGSNQGLGFVILMSSYRLETVRMFSAIAASALGGIMFFYLVSWIEEKIVFWARPDD